MVGSLLLGAHRFSDREDTTARRNGLAGPFAAAIDPPDRLATVTPYLSQ